jgi:hypothetical protein
MNLPLHYLIFQKNARNSEAYINYIKKKNNLLIYFLAVTEHGI